MKPSLTSTSALILIVIAQFLGTSLWFAGNAVAVELSQLLGSASLVATITSSVQFGFILGTLVFAFLSIPDRFSPGNVFLLSAILAAFFNLLITLFPLNLALLISCRFLVGFFLAGIYPVGMKIAADYFEKGLGVALGFLVGALVLGTGFPHLIKGLGLSFDWQITFYVTSALAIIGGVLIGFFVPNGPFRKQNPVFDLGLLPKLAQNNALKSAASGYFGHMWELYTFWAFLPMLIIFLDKGSHAGSFVSLISFAVIASGAVSCAVGGLISRKIGSRRVAAVALLGSGICCFLILFASGAGDFFWIPLLFCWGLLVTADSPQFSTLVAQSVIPEFRGTALTLVNSLGFFISILSILISQFLLNYLAINQVLFLLILGPMLGMVLFRFFLPSSKSGIARPS